MTEITKEDLLELKNDLKTELAVNVNIIAVAVDKANKKLDKLAELGPLLEHVDKKVLVVAEGQTAMREEMQRSMTEMEARLEQRIATLEGAVRRLAADVNGIQSDVTALKSDVTALKSDVTAIKSDVTAIKSDFTHLTSEVADLRRSFERRDDLEALEKRVTLLEKELAGR